MSRIHELAIPRNHSKQYPKQPGQGISLIVGLGDYSGGELCVEDEVHDIRQARGDTSSVGWQWRRYHF